MPNPKRKHSKSRTAKRRGGKNVKKVSLSSCSNCKSLKPSHVVCPVCGYYKDKLIVPPKEKTKKKS